jgi:EAL domain-containing protein (putative c-di-GMP-specific phosphodiesterase class I)
MGQVLLADDNRELLFAYARVLRRAHLDVVTVGDGPEAFTAVGNQSFDAIVSDISMPGMTGLQLLRAVREHDLDVPIILMTGGSALKVATEALSFGATRFLLKPVQPEELVATVNRAVGLHNLARLKRQALELLGHDDKLLGDSAALTVRFERALSSLWMAFQPIVAFRERRVHAYEALVRSAEPTLLRPDLLLEAAQRLGRLTELGRLIRATVTRAAAEAPSDALLFVNVQSEDFEDEQLYAATSPLSALGRRIVLEITERAAIDKISRLGQRVAQLRQLGFAIAVDDLGAGYAGLSTLALLEPEVVKIDMSLVRGIDQHPVKRGIVESMVRLCEQLGMRVVCEGVETVGERDVLLQAGGNLLQGYLFARPDRGFPTPRFDA